MNIAFFGTSEFASAVLARLIESDYKPSLAVTQPDMPTGRRKILTPPPLKLLAERNKIPVFQPQKFDSTAIRKLRSLNLELAIVAAYGKIVPKEILDIPKHGALNVHPSLLPRWRGPSPIQYAILNGDAETGVTIMLMDEEIDHGPVLARQEFSIFNFQFSNGTGKASAPELSRELAEVGANLLVAVIPKWIGGAIDPKRQDHSKATYSKILTREDGRIDWSKRAEEIERQIRAFAPWPGTFTFWNNERIKILKGRRDTNAARAERFGKPGEVLARSNGLGVQTGEGIFVIENLQPEGKNEVNARQFLNGHQEIIGAQLK